MFSATIEYTLGNAHSSATPVELLLLNALTWTATIAPFIYKKGGLSVKNATK